MLYANTDLQRRKPNRSAARKNRQFIKARLQVDPASGRVRKQNIWDRSLAKQVQNLQAKAEERHKHAYNHA